MTNRKPHEAFALHWPHDDDLFPRQSALGSESVPESENRARELTGNGSIVLQKLGATRAQP